MKQIQEIQFPQWLSAVVHFQTRDFLSNPHPKFGEEIEVRVRVPENAPLKRLILRTIPNGEQQFSGMKIGAVVQGYATWVCHVALREPLNPYYFILDTEDGLWYLDALGVHQTLPVNAQAFKLLTDFTEIPWLSKSVFYQIFPDRFANGDPANDPIDEHDPVTGGFRTTYPWGKAVSSNREHIAFYGGDLKGIQNHLDHLLELGVNAIYLNPVFTAWTNHRYDVRDYFSVDPTLGGDAALLALAEELKVLGMHYVLDIVPNHCGIGHPWFFKARQDPDSEEASFFYFDEKRENYVSWMGFRALPKLNFRSQALRERLYGEEGVFSYWLKPPFNADGWRVDVGNMLGRQDTDQISDLVIRGIRVAVKTTKPEAYIFGENFYEAASQLQGDQWDGVMNYMGFSAPLLAWLKTPTTGAIGWDGELSSDAPWQTASLAKAWTEHLAAIPWSVALQQYNLLSGHDTPRVGSILEGDKTLLRLAFIVLFTFPGVPSLFYGDEIGLMDQISFGPRVCMPWDEATWDQALFAFIKELVALRKRDDCLAQGAFQILHWEDDLLIYQRELDGKHILVTLNRSDKVIKAKDLFIPESGISHGYFREFLGAKQATVEGGLLKLPDLPKGGMIWMTEKEI
jgi:alpha-glucosidase